MWRSYTSVNVLQLYELLWIGCHEMWRFYTSVNILQLYKQLWIGCHEMWRFYTSVNVLQWYKLLWIGCHEMWRFYTPVNVLQPISTNRIQQHDHYLTCKANWTLSKLQWLSTKQTDVNSNRSWHWQYFSWPSVCTMCQISSLKMCYNGLYCLCTVNFVSLCLQANAEMV